MSDLTEFEGRILENIKRSGCHINGVHDPDGNEPSFCYSVGFRETVNQPDIIIFGLDGMLMGKIINMILDQCRGGLQLADGLVIRNVLENADLVAMAVPRENIEIDYFNSAMWFSETFLGEEMTEAFQIVWPGYHDGLFPWDSGVDASVIESQPALYEKK